MKIMTVVGARPQFIKNAMITNELNKRKEINEISVHTGQHYDDKMSEIFYKELRIKKPNHNLGIGGGTNTENTARIMVRLEEIVVKEKPDLLIVYGDTDSTLAAALVGGKLKKPVAHVEAGLRSFNKEMPEEINRILTDHISSMLYAPTGEAVNNLTKENIDPSKILNVGDIMYEAKLFYSDLAKRPTTIPDGIENCEYILATIHRAENVDNAQKLKNILDGIGNIDKDIILPIHPRTRKKIEEFKLNIKENIKIIEPVGYLEMMWLEKYASLIITDSGGVQKEAYFHKKICLTIREETEWRELVNNGINLIVGTEANKISEFASRNYIKKFPENIYGEGDSSRKIIDDIMKKI